jgi:hypothetical protein
MGDRNDVEKDALKKLADAGEWHRLYGSDSCMFKLDETIYEAEEDESDGYRSYLGSIEVRPDASAIFFANPVAVVKVVEVNNGSNNYDDVDGYHVVDADGHVWLQIGTSNTDDYYPCFRFVWSPKAPPASPEET